MRSFMLPPTCIFIDSVEDADVRRLLRHARARSEVDVEAHAQNNGRLVVANDAIDPLRVAS